MRRKKHGTPDHVTIYALCEPDETQAIRSIGQTQQTLRQRLSLHMSDAIYLSSNQKVAWLHGLRERGLRPIIKELERCPLEEANAAESRHQDAARQAGYDLLDNERPRPSYIRPGTIRGRKWVSIALTAQDQQRLVEWASEGGGDGHVGRLLAQIVHDVVTNHEVPPAE